MIFMEKTNSPVNVASINRARDEAPSTTKETTITFVNFNDTTVLHIFQVLSDLLAEQDGFEPVKLTVAKEA